MQRLSASCLRARAATSALSRARRLRAWRAPQALLALVLASPAAVAQPLPGTSASADAVLTADEGRRASRAPQPSRALPPLPATRLDEGASGRALDDLRGLSVTFAKALPLRDVLLLLFRNTPFSVVLDPAASGSFAGELRDVTLRQALESVLAPGRLDYVVEGSVVRVFPRTPQTRFFALDHLHGPRAGVDAFAEIGDGVRALLSAEGRQHVDRKASLVQVTDFADRLDAVGAYIETARLRMSRQVRLQARILEITRPDPTPVDWSTVAGTPGSGSHGGTSGAGGVRIHDVDAWLAAMGRAGPLRTIAAPTLLATSNEPAILRAADGADGSEIRLTLTAQIASDGFVMLHAAPQYIAGSFTASMDTVLRLADGETAFIGGLLRRGPSSHAEVVVLLTVAVVRPDARESTAAGPLAK